MLHILSCQISNGEKIKNMLIFYETHLNILSLEMLQVNFKTHDNLLITAHLTYNVTKPHFLVICRYTKSLKWMLPWITLLPVMKILSDFSTYLGFACSSWVHDTKNFHTRLLEPYVFPHRLTHCFSIFSTQ